MTRAAGTAFHRTCEWCGAPFTAGREHARFCSATHRVAWNRAHRDDRDEAPVSPPDPATRNTAETLDRIVLAVGGVEPPRVDEVFADPAPDPDPRAAELLDTLWELIPSLHSGRQGAEVAEMIVAVRNAIGAPDWTPKPHNDVGDWQNRRSVWPPSPDWNDEEWITGGPLREILRTHEGVLAHHRGRRKAYGEGEVLRQAITAAYAFAADQFHYEERVRIAAERRADAEHAEAGPDVGPPARGTRALVGQLQTLIDALVTRDAESYARRTRRDDRADARAEIEKLRETADGLTEWLDEAEEGLGYA